MTREDWKMSETAIQIRADGTGEIYRGGRQYLRVLGDDSEPSWFKRTSQGLRPVSEHRARRLERIYRHRDEIKQFRRYPRETAEDVGFYRTAYLIAEIEKEAIEWIGRGREANVELGRRFIRLKDLVSHGNFKAYYEAKFGTPYGIKLRTAQSYMSMARKADEKAEGAGLALFPPATDPHAVAVREAAERARQGVAHAAPDSSSDSASNDAEAPANSICIFRPYIRMTKEQRDTVVQLWKSEHRHSVDSDVTDYLLRLCEKYDVSRSDSAAGDD
jgi:hypothetical protein